MRKVLSFVLVLSLVLGSVGMAFAATPSDVAGKDCEVPVAVLTDLGIVKGYEDGSYKPEGIVTRAEMAVLVVNALGLQDYVTATAKSTFKDMAGYGWAEGYVAYAQSLGVISGYGDGTFKPGKTVSYDEAATMMVAALGYNTNCLQGTWPANFVTKAKALGILDDIKAGPTGANRGDVAIMLFQTLDQAIGKVNNDNDWVGYGIKFDKDGKATQYDTMLNRLGAEMYEPSTYVDKDDESFILTEDIADDAVANVRAYVGAVVSAYANSDQEIIAIKEVFSTFVTGTYDSSDKVLETTAADYDYSLGSNTSAGAFFYNGEEKGSGSEFTLDPTALKDDVEYTLAVDLSGKKIKEVYSIMYWAVTDAEQVTADDLADIEKNNELLGVDFPEDDNDAIDATAFELFGVNTLADIEKDDVVYVYEGKGEDIARVAVGQKEVSGEVTKVNSKGDQITIDGAKYKYASKELNGTVDGACDINKIEAGDEVKLFLDAYGYIYDYEEISGTADNYAIVLKSEDKEDNKISSDYLLKLYLASDEAKVFTVDDDEVSDKLFKADGTWNKDADGVTTGAIVKYGVDKNGVITTIEGVLGINADLKVVSGATDDVTAKGYYNGKKIASDAVIYSQDSGEDADDADAYSVVKYDGLLGADDVESIYYIVEDDEIVAMLVSDEFTTNDVYGVATDWQTNNSDPGAEIEFLIDGKTETYNADDGTKAYERVNSVSNVLYQIKFDADKAVNEVVAFDTVLASDDEVRKAEITTTNALGPDAKFENDTFKTTTGGIALTEGKTMAPATASSITVDSDAVVYIWDASDEEFTKGSKSDLRSLDANSYLEFYDVADNDKIYDVVIIRQP